MVDKKRAKELSNLYYNTLYNEVIPFWIDHSLDTENGGYFTCLDEKGNVFDTDKFVWLQARQVWMFSKLYNVADAPEETKKKWLQVAKLGADFLEKYGHDDEGMFYFSLTKRGKPIIQPYNIFSDCFAAMAFAQYYKASSLEWAKKRSIQCFENIQKRKENPKGKYNKAYPGTRNLSSLAVPMIDINLCLEMKEVLPDLEIQNRVEENLTLIFDKFLDKKKGVFRENVSDDPEAQDTFEGRLINPGHTIECLWFIMDVADKLNIRKKELIDKCCDILLKTLEFGWDKEFGGIFYFMDIENKPPQQLEWDQKLWWVHMETLIALAKAFLFTQKKEFADWYNKVHEYTWNHFYDKENKGEWWGYLNRRGEVLLRLKGGKWKGCFHIPRGLLYLGDTFKRIHETL